MKSDQLSPLELFRIFDKDGSGELNVDEVSIHNAIV